MKPRLLVIPHVSADDILVREKELARRLTAFFDVYCLKWADPMHVEGATPARRRWKQLRTSLAALLARRQTFSGNDGVQWLRTRVLQPVLLRRAVGARRALAWSQHFNHRVVEDVMRRHGIGCILLATDKFGFPARKGSRVFYDFVDWYPEENATPEERVLHRSRVEAIARHSDGIFAISEPLCEKLAQEYGISAVALPNGANLEALRSVSPAAVQEVRRRWGLEDKFVVGYIGNHGSFTGVDFAVRAYHSMRRRMPDARLLIVGPAEYWRELLEANRSSGVVWTGAVPPAEVVPYFHAIDVGILAQGKSLGTDLAFQIKVVEYTACRKFVVSTPLRTWQQLAWPNVLLVEQDESAWCEAIVKARASTWDPAWDAVVEPYDWNTLAARAAQVMLGAAQK